MEKQSNVTGNLQGYADKEKGKGKGGLTAFTNHGCLK